MKKFFSILVACFIMAAPLFGENKVTSASVNFRTEATTKSDVITVIPKGTIVNVISSSNEGWSFVTYSDKKGYISSKYLKAPVTITNTSVKYYINSKGEKVQSPTYYPTVPAGATAICRDGTYSFSKSRKGTCSHHGGVAKWLK